ncbi:MAG: aminoacyl-tRNA hydrolase [Proteobacteria bacterium]|nr:aminoacyl-tRNA hydrolase [Pseudomonadota bacterium]MBU1708927.1 aminoacyl-tRNA hydrolase [Pseudomonadota bacterium]
MFLLVGLGNPGDKYSKTRHNIGFLFIDAIASKNGLTLKGTKWRAQTEKVFLWRNQVMLVKPETFMNLSGEAVQQIADYYQVEPQKIIVVHDDMDLMLGQLKISINRGAGGHNGIRSIINLLGTKEFLRIRVGVGRPDAVMRSSDFVLSKFNDDEMPIIQEQVKKIEEIVDMLMNEGVLKTMNFYHDPIRKENP